MSSTRHAPEDSPLRQERFASSVEFERGLMANLVAKRCQCLPSAEDRAWRWAIQYYTLRQGGTEWLLEQLKSSQVDARNFVRIFDRQRLVEYLAQLCLDPSIPCDGGHLEGMLSAAQTWIRAQVAELDRRFVRTSVGKQIFGVLEETLQRRCMSIVDGRARIGKTAAVKAWCQMHPGRARYVQVPACNDEIGFFRAIARAIGVSINLNSKAHQLRDRICDALQPGDLMLCLDEAHGLWPQSAYRDAVPKRVSWVMVELVNYGVPVCLVTTPQFIRSQKAVESKTAWTSEQFVGRIGRYLRLPETLSEADLAAVAKSQLPEGNEKAIAILVAYAQSSMKYLAGIETAVSSARYLAQAEGRGEVTTADIKRAIRDSVMPSDSALHEALASDKPRNRKTHRIDPGRAETAEGSLDASQDAKIELQTVQRVLQRNGEVPVSVPGLEADQTHFSR